MRIRVTFAAALLCASLGGVAAAQGNPPSQPQQQPNAAPAAVSGRVVEIDQKAGRLVIQGNDGQRREFKVSPGELGDTKVGDEVEATRVPSPSTP